MSDGARHRPSSIPNLLSSRRDLLCRSAHHKENRLLGDSDKESALLRAWLQPCRKRFLWQCGLAAEVSMVVLSGLNQRVPKRDSDQILCFSFFHSDPERSRSRGPRASAFARLGWEGEEPAFRSDRRNTSLLTKSFSTWYRGVISTEARRPYRLAQWRDPQFARTRSTPSGTLL